MKIQKIISVVVFLLATAAVAFAKPVYLAGEAWVDAEKVGDVLRVNWKYSDPKDMWQTDQIQFCADPLRADCEPNVPFRGTRTSDKTQYFDIPMEVISGGQSAFNLASDGDWFNALWLGIPSKNLHVGKNLMYYRSQPDPNIPKSGGMHLLYVGSGAPFVPGENDTKAYKQTDGNVGVSAAAASGSKKKKASGKKDDCTDCEKKIIQKVDDVKKDTTAIRESVGEVDKTEPAEIQTIQAKSRKIMKALGEGKPDKAGKQLTAHEKLGEPEKPGDTVFRVAEETKMASFEAKEASRQVLEIISKPWYKKWEFWVLGVAALILLGLLIRRGGGKRSYDFTGIGKGGGGTS